MLLNLPGARCSSLIEKAELLVLGAPSEGVCDARHLIEDDPADVSDFFKPLQR